MAWYTCVVNQVGPITYGPTTNPNVILNLTDTAGSFSNIWFFAGEGAQTAMLSVAMVALTNNKHLAVGATEPNPGNAPYTGISNLYLLST